MRMYTVHSTDGWEHRFLGIFSTARKAIKFKRRLEKDDDWERYYVLVNIVDKKCEE